MTVKKLRIVHIINSFEYGGAESMLCNLLLRMDTDRFEPFVVSLTDDLTVAGPILDRGIPLATMKMRPGVPDPRGVIRLAWHLRRVRPDVIQTWMDHSNLIGGLAARICRGARIVWGVHHCDHVAGLTKRTTLLTVASCAKLSRVLPDRIVLCSEHGRTLYGQRGFDDARMMVIPNGFDTKRFRPNEAARRRIREEHDLEPHTPVIGLVARYDPLKDHENFVRAAAMLLGMRPKVRFLMCGTNVDRHNEQLMRLIDSLGIGNACRLLGPRRDVADVYAGLDLLTSSSVSEAFPLALGEAMSCGIPCVATDVGDSRLIVGEAGRIVPPRNPQALASAWRELFDLSSVMRHCMGVEARRRIVEMFDLDAVTRRYEQLYLELHARPEKQFYADARSTAKMPMRAGGQL